MHFQLKYGSDEVIAFVASVRQNTMMYAYEVAGEALDFFEIEDNFIMTATDRYLQIVRSSCSVLAESLKQDG